MAQYIPVTVSVKQGGKLLTNMSSSEVGLANYVTKLTWRRITVAEEARREGMDYFIGNQAKATGNQPFPNGVTEEEITLIHLGRRPNGQTAVIVGTQDKLWRFFANDTGEYIEDQDDYVAVDYVADLTGDWILIGSGFSLDGHRWEAVNLGGTTIFNNGVDLPQAYRLEWSEVQPLYELREAGIASVGTIAVHSSILLVGDVREMQEDTLETSLILVDSGVITAAQVGAAFSAPITASVGLASQVVVASAPIFVAGDVGKNIRFTDGFSAVITVYTNPGQVTIDTPAPAAVVSRPFWIGDANANVVTASAPIFAATDISRFILWDTGEERQITGFSSPQSITVDLDYAIASGTFSMERTDAYGTVTTFIDRIQYQVAWSMPDEPTRWGPTVPISARAGEYAFTLRYPLRSLAVGDDVTLVGAGPAGGNLDTTIVAIRELGRLIQIADIIVTTTVGGYLVRTDAPNSLIGTEYLQGDGSGILRMLSLDQTLVIYKDTTIFLAAFTGVVEAPWAFTDLNTPDDKTLFYRWSVVDVQGDYHLYAGKNGFFRFDLTTRVPSYVDTLEFVSNLYFQEEDTVDIDAAWAAINLLTNEVWFHIPNEESTDKFICFDYKFNTTSTTDMDVTAAATVKRPTTELQVEQTDDWFVMGNAESTILIYGLSKTPLNSWDGRREIYYRRSSNPYTTEKSGYTSRLKSGLSDFGAPDKEKDLDSMTPFLASQQSDLGEPEIRVNFYGTSNAATPPRLLDFTTVSIPSLQNLIPVFFRQHFFQSELVISGMDNPVRYSAQTWMVSGIPSKGVVRRPI